MDKKFKDYADANHAGIKTSCRFMEEVMIPRIRGLIKPSQRELILINIYYRIFLFTEAAYLLNRIRSFQSAASSTRSVFELLVDLKLIIKNKIPDALNKYNAFTIIEKARVAKITLDYYIKQKSSKVSTTPIQHFLSTQGSPQNVQALIIKNWGLNKKRKPKGIKHWTAHDLKGRVNMLDGTDQEFYMRTYPMLSWYIHSAAGAGFVNVNEDGLVTVISWSYKLLLSMFIESTLLLGQEFHFDKGDPDFKKWLKRLEAIPGVDLLIKEHPELNPDDILSQI